MSLVDRTIEFTSRTVTQSGNSTDGALGSGIFLLLEDVLDKEMIRVMKIVADGRTTFTFKLHTSLPGAIRLEGPNKISLSDRLEDNTIVQLKGTLTGIGYEDVKDWLDAASGRGVVANEDQMKVNENNLETLAKRIVVLNIPEDVDVELVLEVDTDSLPHNPLCP